MKLRSLRRPQGTILSHSDPELSHKSEQEKLNTSVPLSSFNNNLFLLAYTEQTQLRELYPQSLLLTVLQRVFLDFTSHKLGHGLNFKPFVSAKSEV